MEDQLMFSSSGELCGAEGGAADQLQAGWRAVGLRYPYEAPDGGGRGRVPQMDKRKEDVPRAERMGQEILGLSSNAVVYKLVLASIFGTELWLPSSTDYSFGSGLLPSPAISVIE